MVPCISGAWWISSSNCSEIIKSSVNHRKAWGEIWQSVEAGGQEGFVEVWDSLSFVAAWPLTEEYMQCQKTRGVYVNRGKTELYWCADRQCLTNTSHFLLAL